SFAYVVQDARLTDELMKFLLRENATLHFGSFGLSFDGTIIFGHSLAGANLDENEFSASIKSVARIADHYDNKIVEMAGGMTAREAMKKGIM
ncbi:MAG TPA: YbjN domain-containing protein, partial [bacterium]|nr:YbjN domain-containing protein [bacterium]